MAKIDAAKLWSLHYRLITSVLTNVAPDLHGLGLEVKELFLLVEIDEHPYPAELAEVLLMPKPTVTVNLKKLEAAGLVRREIDAKDLRRHRLIMTPAGRKAMVRGLAMLSESFGARLGQLNHAEQNQLQGLLEKLSR